MQTIICLAISLCLSFLSATGQSLHTIVVTDPNSLPARHDKKKIRRELSVVAKKTGLKLKPRYFSSHQTGLANTLRSISCKPDDVLLFYFSGHASSKAGWPSFANRGDGVRYKQTGVHKALAGKGARLTIILFDGCNAGNSGEAVYNFSEVYKIGLSDNLRLLFRKSRGTVIACASRAGNYAYGNNDIGSFFTLSLIEAMRNVPAGKASDRRNVWSNWAKATTKGTNSLCRQAKKTSQNPQYYINVTTDPY